MRFYIIILLSFITSIPLSANNLFNLNESSKIVATKNKHNTIGLFLSLDVYQNIVLEKEDNFFEIGSNVIPFTILPFGRPI